MNQKFDLSKAGQRMFVSSREARSDWETGQCAMEVTDKHIYLSSAMCAHMGVLPDDKDYYFTIFFEDDGMYLANVSSHYEHVHKSSLLKLSQPIKFSKERPHKGARSARNMSMVKAYTGKAGHDYGTWYAHHNVMHPETNSPYQEAEFLVCELHKSKASEDYEIAEEALKAMADQSSM